MSCWQSRSKFEKCLLVAITLVLVVIIILAERICKYWSQQQKDTCDTPECIHTASYVMKSIDQNVDPCDDFYQFACGNFMKTNVIPPDQACYDGYKLASDEIIKKLQIVLDEEPKENDPTPFKLAHSLYKACINTHVIEQRGITPVLKILEVFGGWPVVNGNRWNENVGDWQTIIKRFRRMGLKHNYIIDFDVSYNDKNSSQYIIQLDSPKLGINRKYLINGTENEIVQEYYNYMVDMAVIYGANRERAKNELMEMLKFEIELAKIKASSEERLNPYLLFNHFTVPELKEQFPQINWLDLLNGLLLSESIDETEFVNIEDLNYFNNLNFILKKTSKRTITNYLMWGVVRFAATYLDRKIQQRQLAFEKSLYGASELVQREKHCILEVEYKLQVSISALYIQKYFNDEIKTVVAKMINEIRGSFKEIIKELDWMDDETQSAAIEKLEKITSHIGYPAELKHIEKVEEYYENVYVDPNQYFESILNITAGGLNRFMRKLKQPVNKTDWETHSSITGVNAYYDRNENSMNFLAGYLQGKYFGINRPAYMNYGSLGFTIGHEIIHGFDNAGRKYDVDGNLKDWWSETTKKFYEQKVECIVDQYSEYFDEVAGLHINGNLSQNENIADNAGIKIAYLAYTKWLENNNPEKLLPGINYTQKQLFWISAGSSLCALNTPEYTKTRIISFSHVPDEYGVNGPIRNMKQFSEDFHCAKGSFMNPEHKCDIW